MIRLQQKSENQSTPVVEKFRSKRNDDLQKIRLMYKLYFKDETKSDILQVLNDKGEQISAQTYQSYQTSIDYVLSNTTNHINKKILQAEARNLNYKLLTRDSATYIQYLDNVHLRQRQDVRQIKIYYVIQKMNCIGTSKRMTNKQVDTLVQILIDEKYLNIAGKKLSTLKNQVIRELKTMYYIQELKEKKESYGTRTKAYSYGYYIKGHK